MKTAYLTPKAAKWYLDNMGVFDVAGSFKEHHTEELALLLAIVMANKPYRGIRTEKQGLDKNCYYCKFGPLSGYYEFNRFGKIK